MTELDRINLKILRALVDDGRLSWRDLTQKVGLSLAPTLRRVRYPEEERYIQGYLARFNEKRLSGAMSVFVSVLPEKQIGDYFARPEEHIVGAPQVMSCFQITGDAGYMLRVIVKDLIAYQVLLANTLTRVPGMVGIKSALAPKSMMLRSVLPL